MASSSRSEADAMIEEFIRLQEAQVTLLKRMLGSSPAAGTSTPSKDADGDPEKETLPVSRDSMHTGQDGMKRMLGSSPTAGTSTPTEDAKGDPEEETMPVIGDSMHSGQDGMAVLSAVPMEEAGEINIEEESDAECMKYALEGMHLREWCYQDPIDWSYALHNGHCKSLMDQLKKDPSLMMLMVDGRTVLHVASICGCIPLVHQVFKNTPWTLDYSTLFIIEEGTRGSAVWCALDARSQLTAHDINTFFVGQKYETRPSGADGQNAQLVEQIRADINQLLLDETNHKVSNSFRADNFFDFNPEFTFHEACRRLQWHQNEHYVHYVKKIIECLRKGGGEKLNCLLQLQDPTGNPPFGPEKIFRPTYIGDPGYVDRLISTFKDLLQSSPNLFGVFVNGSDTRGWTALHKYAARGYHQVVERVMKEESIDGNLTLPKSRATPLHLAILHNHPQVVKILLMAKDKVDVNAIFERSIVYGDKDKSGNERRKEEWTPLQLAAIMGHSDVVHELLTKGPSLGLLNFGGCCTKHGKVAAKRRHVSINIHVVQNVVVNIGMF